MDLSERLPGDVPVNLVMLITKKVICIVIYPWIKPKLFAKKLWPCSKVAYGIGGYSVESATKIAATMV